jgi:hypothetical protein
MQWLSVVEYSVDSPSGLVWSKDIYSGYSGNILMVSSGDVAGSYSGSPSGGKYFKFQYNNIKYLCHRVIWELFNGPCQECAVVDHIDGNTENNCISNLREVTLELNARNKIMMSNNTSGVTGVSFKSQNGYSSWVASWVDFDGVRKTKAFSIAKFRDSAKIMAELLRQSKLPSLGYTDRHGMKGMNE